MKCICKNLTACRQVRGEDSDDNLYKGIMVFMTGGMKQPIPFAVQAVLDVTTTGKWLLPKMENCIESSGNVGLTVCTLVADNHWSNVSTLNLLKKKFRQPKQLFIDHPLNHGKHIYFLFDPLHLIKNIRNKLLAAKKFVFPPSNIVSEKFSVHSPGGYVSWSDLHQIYENDLKMQAPLKQAHKLTYEVLHPGNNK